MIPVNYLQMVQKKCYVSLSIYLVPGEEGRGHLSVNDKANGAKCYQLVHLGQEHVSVLCTIIVI